MEVVTIIRLWDCGDIRYIVPFQCTESLAEAEDWARIMWGEGVEIEVTEVTTIRSKS